MNGGIRYRLGLWSEGERERITGCDVEIHTASLLASDADVERTLAMLSRKERERYDDCKNAVVARRFAIGRAILRRILGSELGLAPAAVPIATGDHGKPVLCRAATRRSLWFSAAHCEDLLLVALSHTADVGIDVERARSIENWERVADRVLDPAERRQLQGAVEVGQDPGRAFLRQWCRVEAELKAIGCGIHGLDAHRAGRRPLGLRCADLDDLPLPADVARTGVRYQAAVALCAPGVDAARQSATATTQDTRPTSSPASTSTA